MEKMEKDSINDICRNETELLENLKVSDSFRDLSEEKMTLDKVDILQIKRNDVTPKDHGWSWFVLFGAFLEMFLLVGIVKSSGILFVAFQEKFNSSSSVTSLLSAVQNVCQSVVALLVMTCGIKLTTCRNLMCFGSIITCISYIITSQATEIRMLLFSHGFLQGVGAGFMQPTALTMVSLYFEKRRSLANSIAVSGGPVGGLIFAPLITKLLSAYGYQGSVLILSGILLNGCVSGAFFRPTMFYTDKSSKPWRLPKNHEYEQKKHYISSSEYNFDKKSDFEAINTTTDDDITQVRQSSNVNIYGQVIDYRCNKSTNDFLTDVEEQNKSFRADSIMQKQEMCVLNDKTISESNECRTLKKDSQLANISDINIPDMTIVSGENDISLNSNSYSNMDQAYISENTAIELEMIRNEHAEVKCVRSEKIRDILKNLSESHNYALLKNPLFYAFLFQGCLICSGTVVAPIFIAPYARDIDISVEDAAVLVTTQSCIDLFSRIIIGYISDKGWLRRSTIVAVATMVVSLSSSLIRFYTDYTLLLGYSIVLGLVSGVYFSLFPVVLIDYLTFANFQTCLGFMALVHGFSVAGAFYFVGYLRDISGSYVIPHQVIGAATGVGTIVLFLLPLIQRL